MLNIYKIVSPNTNRFYIGSTIQNVSNRFACHRSYYRSGCQTYSSYDIFDAGDATFEVIDSIPIDHPDANNIERKYIQNEDSNLIVNYHYVEGRRNRKTSSKYKKFKVSDAKKTKCICGCDIDFYKRKQHFKSKKHSRNIRNIFADI